MRQPIRKTSEPLSSPWASTDVVHARVNGEEERRRAGVVAAWVEASAPTSARPPRARAAFDDLGPGCGGIATHVGQEHQWTCPICSR